MLLLTRVVLSNEVPGTGIGFDMGAEDEEEDEDIKEDEGNSAEGGA